MNKPLNISIQKLNLEKTYPNFDCNFYNNKGVSKLTVVGYIQPTPLSEKYKFQLNYIFKKSPEIIILSPKLKSISKEKSIPHVYPGDRLCLYYYDWDTTKLISSYIIPWISEWLYYYEVWHATGEWLGGGIHPKKNIPKINSEKSVKNKFQKNK